MGGYGRVLCVRKAWFSVSSRVLLEAMGGYVSMGSKRMHTQALTSATASCVNASRDHCHCFHHQTLCIQASTIQATQNKLLSVACHAHT